MKKTVTALSLWLMACMFFAHEKTIGQSLPRQMTYAPNDHRLKTGGVEHEGFYDEMVVNTIELFFDEPHFWDTLRVKFQTGTDLGALAIINGDTLSSEIGVRFKGATSYFLTGYSQKKSFNLTLDFVDSEQNYEGHETLNLNNCFQDPSFMREVLFYHMARKHIPVANANFTQLFINGENWGVYPNVQQLNGEYLDEWFLSDEGTSWRALDPEFVFGGSAGNGGGNIFGTGFSTLNWLGNDASEYQKWYTLKRTSKVEPWGDLVRVCDVLNNSFLDELEVAAIEVMDIDRTLWYLAHEIVFTDDDSYVYKGGMDYYLYWEPETGRMTPLEYDANSCMMGNLTNWSPFYHEDDEKFVLMNRLFAVPELRQRYLAHVRTIIEESLNQETFETQVDTYFELIDDLVEEDEKKIYSYDDFLEERETLKAFAEARRNFLLSNEEVNTEGLEISGVVFSADNSPFTRPDPGQTVTVTANISGTMGASKVNLYHGTGFVGKFAKQEMHDDGAHGDGAAGDGIYGAELPGYGNGQYVRFYIEAVADDVAKTVTYEPAGAEHDVYIYRVNVNAYVNSEVVINEFMARNDTTHADEDGEFDDWIELYNNSSMPADLTGWYLTDDPNNLEKWQFRAGTIIDGAGYLIVWADEDEAQSGLHTNFKLAGSGEVIYLLNPALEIAQEIHFGQQEKDLGFARFPNGYGNFVIQNPTFGYNNGTVSSAIERGVFQSDFSVYPNPANRFIHLEIPAEGQSEVMMFNLLGEVVFRSAFIKMTSINVSSWQPGLYLVQIGDRVKKIMVE